VRHDYWQVLYPNSALVWHKVPVGQPGLSSVGSQTIAWFVAHEERQSDSGSPVVCVAQQKDVAPTSWVHAVESLHERNVLGVAQAEMLATHVSPPPEPMKPTQQPWPLEQRVLPQATPSGT
jgi:hypothetical protein